MMNLMNWKFHILNPREIMKHKITNDVNKLIYGIDNPNKYSVSLILPNIWLGDRYIAYDYDFMIRERVGHIINITEDVYNIFDFITYTNYRIKDVNTCYFDAMEILETGAYEIYRHVNKNIPILIHCKQGHHRSAAMVAFYLMKYQNMTLCDAISTIKTQRPKALRRMTCMMKTLIEYETDRYIK